MTHVSREIQSFFFLWHNLFDARMCLLVCCTNSAKITWTVCQKLHEYFVVFFVEFAWLIFIFVSFEGETGTEEHKK